MVERRTVRDGWYRIAMLTGISVAVLVGLIGFAHTPMGRPLLSWLGVMPGCPVDSSSADPVAVERYRRARVLERRGNVEAMSHRALDFELGETRQEQVRAWAEAHARDCESLRQGSVLQCGRAESSEGLSIENIHFQFDAEGRLVALDLFRERDCTKRALRVLSARREQLTSWVGPPTRVQGGESQLQAQRFASVAYEFRYRAYVAKLSATNLGKQGVMVRESYQWAG